jgi:hypothetical protein
MATREKIGVKDIFNSSHISDTGNEKNIEWKKAFLKLQN